VLRPVRLADRQQLGEWVLYLDGFGPHHPIQTDDTRKRMAVLRSGRRVWTLTWHDLPSAGTKPDSVNETYLTSHRSPQWLQAYDKLAERFGWTLTGKLDELIEIGPYGVLVRLLTLPTATLSQLHELPIALAIGWLHKPSLEAKMLDSIDVDAQRVLPLTVRKAMAESSEHLTIGGLLPGIGRDTTPVRLLSVMPKGALTSKERLLSQVSCHICLDEKAVTQTKEFELVWRGFWYAANMLQLAPGFTVTTEGGVGVHAYESALSNWGSGRLAAIEEHEAQQGTPWAEVMGDAEIDSFALGRLADAGLPVPVVGLDLAHGLAVVANAELAWPDQSIAVLLAVEQGLQVDGWTLIGVAEDGWIDRVIAQFATNGEKSDA
jgi:DEAD/DEAH box helicase domain-containing protein